MPIWRLMMNSMRAKPMPSLGRPANEKASSGLPTFIMIFTGDLGILSKATSVTSTSSKPA